MATRSTDSHLSILLESIRQEHLSIKGTRLPTHYLLCHLSHIEKFQNEDNTRQNNCSVPSARATFEQVKIHYIKANIEMISEQHCISKSDPCSLSPVKYSNKITKKAFKIVFFRGL